MTLRSALKSVRSLCLFLCGITLMTGPSLSQQPGVTQPTIHVLASTSLVLPLTELAREYSKLRGVAISVTYSDPVSLQEAVETGDPADLFISEHPVVMQKMKQKGLIDVQSISLIARNRIVLVTTRGSRTERMMAGQKDIHAILKKMGQKVILALGSTQNTALGVLSEASLFRLGYWNRISPYVMRFPTAQQVVKAVEQNTASAGIVYFSDVLSHQDLVTLAVIPEETHDPIHYTAAVVAGNNMAAARLFLDYLKSADSSKIFHRLGFSME